MKGYTSPKAFVSGHCFVCGKSCDKETYCHYECAIALSDEKAKRIKEARELKKNEL